MRFLQFMIVSFAVFTTALFGSCTSKEGSGEEPESPTTTSYKVRVKVSTGEYTRAGDDAAVNTLHLAFYNGEECLGIVEATKVGSVFECSIPTEYGKPDGVIAFANLPAGDLPTKDNVMTKTYSNFGNGDNMIMSSARYFDASGNDKLKTPLSTMNLVEGGRALNIKLDRIVSKVTVRFNSDSEFENFSVIYGDNTEIPLTLKILYWAVTGTERGSFLVKNFSGKGKEELDLELDGWSSWNINSGISHWAHSITWDDKDAKYPLNKLGSDNYAYDFLNIESVTNNFNTSQFYHETTRSKDWYNIDNAVASLVIVGKYTGNNINGKSFYNYKGSFYLGSDYVSYFKGQMLKNQTILYKENDSNPINRDMGEYFKICHPEGYDGLPDSYVTIQLADNTLIQNVFFDKDMKSYQQEDRDMINRILAQECGFAEEFTDGRCYFMIPIQNIAYANTDQPQEVTGCYGLVRNHHYIITINDINGIGSSIISNDCVPLKYTYSGQSSSAYKVNANVSVNEWQYVNQTVDIPKN